MPKNCVGSISIKNLVQLYDRSFYFFEFSGTGNIAAADTQRFAVANLVTCAKGVLVQIEKSKWELNQASAIHEALSRIIIDN